MQFLFVLKLPKKNFHMASTKARFKIDFVYITIIIVVDISITKPRISFHAARVAINRERYLEGGGHEDLKKDLMI